jgi:hypothetical protein
MIAFSKYVMVYLWWFPYSTLEAHISGHISVTNDVGFNRTARDSAGHIKKKTQTRVFFILPVQLSTSSNGRPVLHEKPALAKAYERNKLILISTHTSA